MALTVKSFHITDAASEEAVNLFLQGKRVFHWSASHSDKPAPGAWDLLVGFEEERARPVVQRDRDHDRERVNTRDRGNNRDRDHERPAMPPREKREPRMEHVPDLPAEMLPLYENLRKWRNGRAREENVKPYMLFNNKQLEDMVKAKPADIDALKTLTPEMSPEHFEKYGNELLGVLSAT